VDEMKSIARETSKDFIVNSKKAVTMIKEQMADLIESGTTILTHSYSSSVIESLSFANSQGRKIKVYVTESRPLFEGRNTANILSNNGVDTMLIADMASFHFLDEVDMILAGCDCICEEGVVNKIGTKGLAITASQLGIPFFIVGEKSKFLPKKYKSAPKQEEKEPEEIFSEDGGFKVKNIYFDMTPYKFIKGIITEEGILDHEEVMAVLDKENVCTRLLYD
jgi:translation initiation factor 2B subunit (eIF-2B alpha/beta/delta family)